MNDKLVRNMKYSNQGHIYGVVVEIAASLKIVKNLIIDF